MHQHLGVEWPSFQFQLCVIQCHDRVVSGTRKIAVARYAGSRRHFEDVVMTGGPTSHLRWCSLLKIFVAAFQFSQRGSFGPECCV